jgi:hypothetical protein
MTLKQFVERGQRLLNGKRRNDPSLPRSPSLVRQTVGRQGWHKALWQGIFLHMLPPAQGREAWRHLFVRQVFKMKNARAD